jgi:carbamoyltransferase
MHILGISCYYHDSAAALLRDGELVAAAQEERFSRIKQDEGYPELAIAFCLRKAGIKAGDLDYVVFYEKPLIKFERILQSSLATFPRSWRTFGEAMVNWFDEKLWIKSRIQRHLGIEPSKILFADHHMAHAASALFSSPFRDAAILTLDGVGEWTTTTKGYGRADWGDGSGNSITLTSEHRFPHSIGLLYSAFTAFLGFQVNEGEYKVMGMAPYGKPKYVDDIFSKIVHRSADGSFSLDMDWFSYHWSPEKSFSSKFTGMFGPPRQPESTFITTETNPGTSPDDPAVRASVHYADVASSIQKVTEELILGLASSLQKETGAKRLCMAGGVALNSVANGRVARELPFEEVFIQPAAGDAGGALGAALWAWHILLGKPRKLVMETSYFGEEYGEDETLDAMKAAGVGFERFDDETRLVGRTVDALLDGRVLGFSQGRFEWGPRALGNRSILADPRKAEMKDIINRKIKFREPFRPFAPAVPEETATKYFEGLDLSKETYPARFMITVVPWKSEYADLAPAVNHGGTGRLQTVRRDWNPRYYDVIKAFGQATGAEVLVNTSFNLRGEPIVSSPADALKTFLNSGIDNLVMGSYWVSKQS